MSSSSGLTERDRERLRSELTPQIDEILHDAGELESVEEVERMACELLLPFQSADAPPEVASALVEAVGDSEAAAAPHLLTAFSVLGRGAVGRAAAASGRQSRFEGLVGRLEPRAAARVIDGAAEMLQVRFERPDTGAHQLGAVVLEREDTGGAALAGGVTAPTPEPGPFLGSPDGARARTVGLDEVRRRIEEALARTAELELAVDRELGVCLPLLAVALTGSADGLPAVDVELEDDGEPAPGEHGPLYVDPLDEDAYMLIEHGLLEELREFTGEDPEASYDHAELFAGSLLHWKWGYVDGRLGTWTAADVTEFMLGHMPRKMPSDEETTAAAPSCIALFLEFLADRGSLAGDPLEELLAAVERAGRDLAEAVNDPGNWGLAKSLVAEIEADGIELSDQAALDAWMEDFNARPPEERDRVLGPALERMGPVAPLGEPEPTKRPRPSGPSKTQRRGKRKQARVARKRNR